MQGIIEQLGRLFLASVPTVVIFLALHFYLRRVLYRPLGRTLAARRERTEGLFEAARQRISQAEEKLAEYECRLREARAEMYHIVEERRAAAVAERAQLLAGARERAEAARRAAEEQLTAESVQARRQLEGEAEAMAGTILATILGAAAPRAEAGA